MNVWGCFTSSGVGRLYKIPGIMDSKMYKQILIHQLIPSANELFKDKSWVFQQDNDPKHTANNVKNYLKNKKLVVLSSQWAPDVNPTLGLRCIFIGNVGRPKTTSEQRQYNNVGSMSFNRRCIDIVRCLTTYIDKKNINTLQSFVC